MALSPELRAVEEAYRAGIARLGIAVAYLSLNNWGTVAAGHAEATGGPWVDRTLRLIQAVRWQSQRLAMSYYQMARAVETGTTLGLPEYTGDANGVTLDGLRTQFVDVLREIDGLGALDMHTDNPDYNWLASELRAADVDGSDANARSVRLADADIERYIEDLLRAGGDDRLIKVDRFTWPRHMTAEEIERAFRAMLTRESLKIQADKAKRILADKELAAERAMQLIEDEHELSGSRGAGWADWASIEAGREVVAYASQSDYRVKAYARQTGPNPCAFCAMLASRGWAYASKDGAGGGTSKYHPNCHCTVICRWQNVTDLPPMSKFYQDSWPGVTRNETGVGKLRAWRRWLAKRGPNTTPTTSQED